MKKRNLTKKEIKTIVSQILYNGCVQKEIVEEIDTRVRERCIEQLTSIQIYPEMIPKLQEELTNQYRMSLVTPGESVGILTAQSIGERNTQTTLNTFHSSGSLVNAVITGIPRFSELMSATKKPKGALTKIFFKNTYHSIRELQHSVYPLLIHTTVQTVMTRLYTRQTPRPWYSVYFKLYPTDIPENFICLTLRTNTAMLYNRRISLSDIASTLNAMIDESVCIPSPVAIGVVDVWIPKSMATEKFIKKFKQITLKGIKDMTSISYEQKDGEWYVIMSGYNMRDLLKISFIDKTRTFSNHVREIHEVLGIEATREFLIKEFINVVSADSYINVRHIQLLVDTMTFTGNITPISRHGIHRNQSGPLTKASFEKTVDNILKSALYGEKDTVNGVSSSIVCGKPCIAGTGSCELFYDDEI